MGYRAWRHALVGPVTSDVRNLAIMQFSPTAYKHSDLISKDPESIVDEMENSDFIDDHSISPPKELWPTDSYNWFIECAEVIEKTNNPALNDSLGRLITYGKTINDYRLGGEIIFGSISPDSAREIVRNYEKFNGSLVTENDNMESRKNALEYFRICINTLKWSSENNYGLIFNLC